MVVKKRKLGRGVAMVGAGMSKFGVRPEKNTRELFVEAYEDMKHSTDKGFDIKDAEALYLGCAGSEMWEAQGSSAIMCANWIGLTPKPAIKLEAACASSQVAFREGIIAIASGLYDAVLVGGTEKMNTVSTDVITTSLASASDTSYEASAGFSFPGFYASFALAHMYKYGTTPEDLMKVAIKNHENGALNPKAQMGATIKTIMEMQRAREKAKGFPEPTWVNEMDFLNDPRANPVIAWPNRLFDCCLVSDGAACILLVAEEIAKQYTEKPIYVIGTGHASGSSLNLRDTFTSIPAAKEAAAQAYAMADVTPADIKTAEVHDCFTIAEVMAIADLGFFPEGKEAARAAGDGKTARNGVKPINPSGGLKSKGHPIGASGAAMSVEIFHQMRNEAGPRQVANGNVDLALTHNVGAHGTTCVVNIYERR
jgi:acetyl-CoA C-acetyltransferase